MGYEKNRRIEEDDQGWSYSDKDICYRCISEPYLRDLARSEASEFGCSFCGRIPRSKPNSIPFNRLMEVVGETVWQYYEHAADCMGWDGREGGFIGSSTYDSYDIVQDFPTLSDDERVVREVIDCLGDQVWCDRSPYSLTGVERYASSWEGFCQTVKHTVRYFFNTKENADEFSDKIPVPEMLDELRDIIDSAGLVETLNTGTKLFRIRPHKREEVCDSWRSLGAPPPELAPSNRMSAAGISVFYAAMDMATARDETTASLDPDDPRILTGAIGTNTRPLKILNLSKLPPAPSIFAQVRYDRDHLIFLKQFVGSITQPVQHDGREHTEYVPSQIVTEYFRHRYRFADKSQLDGLVYPSAQRKGGQSAVIFASPDDLNPHPHDWVAHDHTPVLTLCMESVRRIRRLQKPMRETCEQSGSNPHELEFGKPLT
jgi:hypothetical protein